MRFAGPDDPTLLQLASKPSIETIIFMYRIFLLVLLFPFLAIAQVVKDNSAGIDPVK